MSLAGAEPTREHFLDSIQTAHEALRRRFRSSFFDFAKHCLGYDLLPHVHGELCESLQLAYWGLGEHAISGGIDRHLKLMPRGSFKTSVITQAWPLWILVQDEPPDPLSPSYKPAWSPPKSFNGKKGYDQRILLGQEIDQNVEKFLAAIKELIANCPMFIELFGQIGPTSQSRGLKWTNQAINIAWRQDYRTKDYNIGTCSLASAANSTHADILVMDDIFGEKQARSAEGNQATIDFYRRLIPIAENPSLMVFVGTRWDDKDLYGYFIESEEERGKWCVQKESAIRSDAEVAAGKARYFFPERLGPAILEDKRTTMRPSLFSCNTGEAPILMADWTLKPLRDVRVGDKVVGFTIGHGKEKSRLCVSEVVANGSRIAKVNKVTMEDGHQIRCTPDHKWYVGKNSSSRPAYSALGKMKKLCRVVSIPDEPTPKEHGDWRYLAGIIDGEGSVKHGAVLIHQSVAVNPHIASRIEETVVDLGLSYTRWTGKSGVRQNEASMLTLHGARDFKLKLNQFGRPAKAAEIADSILARNPSGVTRAKVKVASIEADGVDTVYSMQTTTGNYVAWGYASKNCQYLNEPIDEETAMFKPSYFEDAYFELPIGPQLDEWLRSLVVLTTADPAISEEREACDAVILTCGWDKDGHCWTLDMFAERGPSPGAFIDELFRQNRVWRPLQIGVEKDKLQKAIMFYANQQSQLLQEWPPFKDLETKMRSKEHRISGLEPVARAKRLHFRRGHESLENEMVRYPRAKTKDRLDALAYQLDLAYAPSPIEKDDRPQMNGMNRIVFPSDIEAAWKEHQARLNIGPPDPYHRGCQGMNWKQL